MQAGMDTGRHAGEETKMQQQMAEMTTHTRTQREAEREGCQMSGDRGRRKDFPS
jgi:hypothetical protein